MPLSRASLPQISWHAQRRTDQFRSFGSYSTYGANAPLSIITARREKWQKVAGFRPCFQHPYTGVKWPLLEPDSDAPRFLPFGAKRARRIRHTLGTNPRRQMRATSHQDLSVVARHVVQLRLSFSLTRMCSSCFLLLALVSAIRAPTRWRTHCFYLE
jgi:hypothetical protein